MHKGSGKLGHELQANQKAGGVNLTGMLTNIGMKQGQVTNEMINKSRGNYFQCASQYSEPTLDCETCTMPTTCQCSGYVKFGYGDRWTDYKLATNGVVECDVSSFGGSSGDPWEGHGKVCMCMEQATPCASEYDHPAYGCEECTMSPTCMCNGQARMGYGEVWTPWRPVDGSVQCTTEIFGDPWAGHGKICECLPTVWPNFTSAEATFMGARLMRAIITVTLGYFIAYALLAVVRSQSQLTGYYPGPIERALESTAESVAYLAPMLIAIYFAVSKRAQTLAAGNPEVHEMPAEWLQYACGFSAGAYCCLLVCHTAFEWACLESSTTALPGSQANLMPPSVRSLSAHQHNQQHHFAQGNTVRVWRAFRDASTIVMYVAVAVSIIGTLCMQEPEDIKIRLGKTPVRATTVCTMILASVYFILYSVLYALRSNSAVVRAEGGPTTSFATEVLKLATTAMNFAPMLCVLFMGAQYAADWDGIELSPYMSAWMYVCLAALLVQVVCVIIAPYASKAELQVSPRGDVDFKAFHQEVFVVFSILRWMAMVVLFVGIGVTFSSLWRLKTVPLMTRMLFRLAVVYFVAYLLLWAAITARQLNEGGFLRAIRTLTLAKNTVVFCPMLSGLFLAAFACAHRYSPNALGEVGVPQGYVQDCMWVAVVALAVQLLMVVAAGTASNWMSNGQGASEKPGIPVILLAGFHLAMLVLYVSVVAVIVGLFTVDSLNATGEGAWFAA